MSSIIDIIIYLSREKCGALMFFYNGDLMGKEVPVLLFTGAGPSYILIILSGPPG